MFIIHLFHGEGAKPNLKSCFGMREPHVWLGIHGQTMEESNRQDAYAWSDEVVEDLKRIGLMMKGGYVALMGQDLSVEGCFGDNWERLMGLKRKLDGKHVFQHTVPPIA